MVKAIEEGDALIVRGKLSDTGSLYKDIQAMLRACHKKNLKFNLSKTTLDVFVLGVMIALARECKKRKGQLFLLNPSKKTSRLLRASKITTIKIIT